MSATTTQFVEGQFMKPAEVMKLLGYRNRSSFWQFVKRTGIPYVSLGLRTKRFEVSALVSFFDAKAVGNAKSRYARIRAYLGNVRTGFGIDEIESAAEALSQSAAGRKTMRDLLAFLDNGGLCLDSKNRGHVITLLDGAWGDYSGTAREVMREQLGKYSV